MGACRERPSRRCAGIEQENGAPERQAVKCQVGQMRQPLILSLILRDEARDDACILFTPAAEHRQSAIAR